MNKALTIGIVFVLLMVCLSGCNEEQADEEENIIVKASCSGSPQTGNVPLVVSFIGSGLTSKGQIISYNWDFGDGEKSSIQNPTHTFQNIGTYYVTLTVTDDNSKTSSDSIQIMVSEQQNEQDINTTADEIEFINWVYNVIDTMDDYTYYINSAFKVDSLLNDTEEIEYYQKKFDEYSNQTFEFELRGDYNESRRWVAIALAGFKSTCSWANYAIEDYASGDMEGYGGWIDWINLSFDGLIKNSLDEARYYLHKIDI